ncbi:MAG: PepSY domain-containing protein [Stellaceae bacterium]
MTGFSRAALPFLALAGAAFAVAPAFAARENSPTATGEHMTRALNMLEANGYGDFQNFHASGSDEFVASVQQQGQNFRVLINPDAGHITRQG